MGLGIGSRADADAGGRRGVDAAANGGGSGAVTPMTDAINATTSSTVAMLSSPPAIVDCKADPLCLDRKKESSNLCPPPSPVLLPSSAASTVTHGMDDVTGSIASLHHSSNRVSTCTGGAASALEDSPPIDC